MKSEEARLRFVESGGWIRQERLTKPKTVVVWGLAGAWFVGFGVAFANLSEVSVGFWKVAALGEVGLLVAGALMSWLEQPVVKTKLIRNPDKKQECLY